MYRIHMVKITIHPIPFCHKLDLTRFDKNNDPLLFVADLISANTIRATPF